MDGWMDGWMDEWMDGKKFNIYAHVIVNKSRLCCQINK